MLKPTKRDIAWAEKIYESYSGESIAALKEEKEKERKEKEKAQKKTESERENNIIRLYKRYNYSIAQIADLLALPVDLVTDIVENKMP